MSSVTDHEKATASELEKTLPGQNTPTSSGGPGGIDNEWTDEEEKTLRNRMDWYIVPLVTVLYLLCFLDRCVPFLRLARLVRIVEECCH